MTLNIKLYETSINKIAWYPHLDFKGGRRPYNFAQNWCFKIKTNMEFYNDDLCSVERR